MPDKKRKQHVLYPTDRMVEMVEAIKKETGYSTISDVYFQGIIIQYQRLFQKKTNDK